MFICGDSTEYAAEILPRHVVAALRNSGEAPAEAAASARAVLQPGGTVSATVASGQPWNALFPTGVSTGSQCDRLVDLLRCGIEV